MKKSLFVAAIAALAVVACKKTEAVDTTNDMDSTAVEATTDSTNMMQDSTTVNAGDSTTVTVEGPAAVTVETPAPAEATK